MIKPGDKVRVTRKPTEEELEAWTEVWVKPMDSCVGVEAHVLSLNEDSAELDREAFYYLYPLCVLEKVEHREPNGSDDEDILVGVYDPEDDKK